VRKGIFGETPWRAIKRLGLPHSSAGNPALTTQALQRPERASRRWGMPQCRGDRVTLPRQPGGVEARATAADGVRRKPGHRGKQRALGGRVPDPDLSRHEAVGVLEHAPAARWTATTQPRLSPASGAAPASEVSAGAAPPARPAAANAAALRKERRATMFPGCPSRVRSIC